MQKEINKLEIELIKEDSDKEFSSSAYYVCNFCEKNFKLNKNKHQLFEKLSRGKIHCPFCLQNNFNQKSNKNILILSFRAIINYYYKQLYLENKKMYFTEIVDYIEAHKKVGLSNPIFRYDDESMLFFVDFSKVGKGPHKMPLKEVHKTVINILVCFNINQWFFQSTKTEKLFEKFRDAVEKFHINRYRPENIKILCPTLAGINATSETISHESFKEFSKKKLFLKP